jgi:hypothetical protein
MFMLKVLHDHYGRLLPHTHSLTKEEAAQQLSLFYHIAPKGGVEYKDLETFKLLVFGHGWGLELTEIMYTGPAQVYTLLG